MENSIGVNAFAPMPVSVRIGFLKELFFKFSVEAAKRTALN